jgi:hypothetical protein
MTKDQLIHYLINSGIIDWEDGVRDCPPNTPECIDDVSCHNCWVKFLTKGYRSYRVKERIQ